MSTKPEELFDVVIYEKATRKVDAIIGTDMRRWNGRGTGRNTVELRVQTGRERINELYGCIEVTAGRFKEGDTLP